MKNKKWVQADDEDIYRPPDLKLAKDDEVAAAFVEVDDETKQLRCGFGGRFYYARKRRCWGLYEEQTQEYIFDRMYDNLPDGTTALEGTFTGNSLQPAASELSEVYLELEGARKESSAVTAEDYENLKYKGADI